VLLTDCANNAALASPRWKPLAIVDLLASLQDGDDLASQLTAPIAGCGDVKVLVTVGRRDLEVLTVQGPAAQVEAAHAEAVARLGRAAAALCWERRRLTSSAEVEYAQSNVSTLQAKLSRGAVVCIADAEAGSASTLRATATIGAGEAAGGRAGAGAGAGAAGGGARVTVEVRQGDWKDCARGVGAIVNPANSKLGNGGGMAMRIEDAAGAEFRSLCEAALRALDGGSLMRGSATLTESGALATVLGIPWVVHCVAPQYETGSGVECSVLRSAIKTSLKLAADKGVTSVAICGVGAGIFQWPPADATREIVAALQQWAASARCDATMRVVLYDISESVVTGFVSALQYANGAPDAGKLQ
jgi:O-acetyl-ADP-ribose deacetylase (regulator of RNase III)